MFRSQNFNRFYYCKEINMERKKVTLHDLSAKKKDGKKNNHVNRL